MYVYMYIFIYIYIYIYIYMFIYIHVCACTYIFIIFASYKFSSDINYQNVYAYIIPTWKHNFYLITVYS